MRTLSALWIAVKSDCEKETSSKSSHKFMYDVNNLTVSSIPMKSLSYSLDKTVENIFLTLVR